MREIENVPWSDWKTVELIGRGGFGTVYEVQRELPGGGTESAALKVITIPQNPGDIEEMYGEGYDTESITEIIHGHMESVAAEYKLMKKMDDNPNIVRCYDFRSVPHDEGIGWDVFIRMELLTPIMNVLPERVPEATVVKVAKDLCNALISCREYNIVHRDIKPQNIFQAPNGDYKLGDFGIAKTMEKTMGGTKIGTYKYMAPEVYNNQPYGHSADIYSLGLVLYWMLNERRMPFLPLPPGTVKAGMEEEARNLRLSGKSIPRPAHGNLELQNIVLKACRFDPRDRYSSAAQMLADLERLYTCKRGTGIAGGGGAFVNLGTPVSGEGFFQKAGDLDGSACAPVRPWSPPVEQIPMEPEKPLAPEPEKCTSGRDTWFWIVIGIICAVLVVIIAVLAVLIIRRMYGSTGENTATTALMRTMIRSIYY